MANDMSSNVKAENVKHTKRCYSCDKYKTNHQFYHWHSLFSDKYLGLICTDCSYKEAFGSKYKQNKKYKTWKEKNNG